MAPLARIVVGPVSIPVQYNIPDAQLFSQKWWAEATKTNLFWTQFKKYISRGTINKRIGLEIKADVVEGTRGLQIHSNAAEPTRGKGRGRPKQQKKRMRPQSTYVASTPTATPGAEEHSEFESEVDTMDERLESDELGIGGGDMPGPRRSARPRRKPAFSPQSNAQSATKNAHSGAFSDISVRYDGTLLCEACNGTVPEVAEESIAVEVPTLSGNLFEPPKDTMAGPSTPAESSIVKLEDEKSELQDRLATTVAATKTKRRRQRQREDDGRILTINGEEWLVYVDEKGDEHTVKLGLAKKKIKIELD
ncbi:hypothetical protein G647_08826 [Cladophialophora carrionii CBS 160.54]|uniref:Uncharacterized protein n=1 Tax=Cladophialophora carrionii CBS 160.54 TaxID=1279043 RepID=V9D0I9_9EURO|nr:uncharacterized protein G647_08826 [Cladophialophora carrionii CBS 160.54]ETI19813.1 hypothetical protein G647_08826 [Cladophialophora carrionii CBS 160.54]